MKKTFFKLSLFFILVLIPFSLVKAENLSKKLSGKILLQVESHGEAWYVNPTNTSKYYMADGNAAYNVMRNLGVGITNDNLAKIQNDKNLAKKQSGKIFLQVKDKGQAYYVNSDGTLYYLKDGNDAYNIMRKLGLGITNSNLNKIPSSNVSATSTPNANTTTAPVLAPVLAPISTSTPDTTLNPNTTLCNGAYYTACSTGQDFICSTDGRAYCQISPQQNIQNTPQSITNPTSVCNPNWQCSTWSTCTNSQQIRTCSDSNVCGITTGKPNETQSCDSTSQNSTTYSDYVLEYTATSTVDSSQIITFYLNTDRNIGIKKIVAKATNMTPDQVVYVNYGLNANTGGTMNQTSDDTWSYSNGINLSGYKPFPIMYIQASGSGGLNAKVEAAMDEWEVWDYTSNKPVKLELTTNPPVIGTLTIAPSLSVTQFIANQSQVTLGQWTIKAQGEDIRVRQLNAAIVLNSDGTPMSNTDGFNNVSLYVNGGTVGSSQNAVVASQAGNSITIPLTFGSTNLFTIPAGTTVTVTIKGDSVNDGHVASVRANLMPDSSAYEGMISYRYYDAGETDGVLLKSISSNATVSANSSYNNQTLSANTNKQKIGSFMIQASGADGDGVNVTSLRVGLKNASTNVDLTASDLNGLANLYIVSPDMPSGSNPVSPNNVNNFSTNFTVAANHSAEVDVYADLSNSTLVPFITTLVGSGNGSTSHQAVTLSSANGQQITVNPK